MKQTSLEIYNKVKASGLLSKNRLLVYEILCRYDYSETKGVPHGLTAHEMRWVAESVFHVKNSEHLPKRLSELESQGVIEGITSRKCRRTGNNATVWRITGRMPERDKPLAPKDIRRERAVMELRALWSLMDEQGLFKGLTQSGQDIYTKRFQIVKDLIDKI